MSSFPRPPGLPASLAPCLEASADRWPFALIAATICVGLALLARHVARRPGFPGRAAFAGFAIASSCWALIAAAEHITPRPECKIAAALNAWPAIVATSGLWALFLWRYSRGRETPLPGWLRAVLWVAPPAAWLAAVSNPLHGLLYAAGTGPLVPPVDGVTMRWERGPLFWLFAGCIYAGMLGAFASAAAGLRDGGGPLARVRLALLGLTLVPWAANASFLFLGLRVMGADPTPLSFLVALAAMPWLVSELRLFDLVPFARSALVDALADPVLVVDDRDRVIDANRAALALGAGAGVGAPLAAWPGIGGALAPGRAAAPGGADGPGDAATLAVAGAAGAEARNFEPVVVALPGGARLLHLRDVTERHRAERRIARALAQRDAEFERASRLHLEFEALALRDVLTALPNRRALDAHFARTCERGLADGDALWVVLIDVDRFKPINDVFGHAVGDEALVAVGERLAAAARATRGEAFRLGGEEFVLIVVGDAQAARDAIVAARASLSRAPLATSAGPLAVTVSGGVACWPAHGRGIREVLHAADRALYLAKARGRDRVLWAGEDDAATATPAVGADPLRASGTAA